MDDSDENHSELSPELYEGLATLFIWWYGNHFVIRKVLRNRGVGIDDRLEDMKPGDIEEAWRNRWFAKGDLQKEVDSFIRNNFAWMLNENEAFHFRPTRLWEKLAMIILFDQITRNALRGSQRAYANDGIALSIALNLMERQLPFQFKATIAICLCHSESLETQQRLASYLSPTPNHRLGTVLLDIAKKHHERVIEFGRFPERNGILERKNTSREEAYLSQLK